MNLGLPSSKAQHSLCVKLSADTRDYAAAGCEWRACALHTHTRALYSPGASVASRGGLVFGGDMSAGAGPHSLFPSGPCSLRATLGTPRLGTPLPQCDASFSPAQGHQSSQWCQAPGGGRKAPCPAGCTLGPGKAWPCLLRGPVVPGAGHLQTERNRSEPPGPGEEMAAWAGPEQDPGRRAGGRSGRKAPGWAGQRAGGPPPRSGRQGWPPG